jgi:hypothetical protein
MKFHPSQVLAAAVMLALTLSPAHAEDAASMDALRKEVQALREEVAALKAARQPLPVTNVRSAPLTAAETPDVSGLLGEDFMKVKGLTIGFYGESKYRFPQNGANTFDAHRYVLTPSYQIADWLVFNSELELEHGGVDESTGRGSRFNGELEVEQFYVDILLNEHFNIRSLGIDLVPVGRINLYHEPTLFYSTERPELYREIIPSTWMEPSLGFFGKITDTLDYRVQISTGLEDFVASFGDNASGDAGITAVNGVRSARPRMRAADENKLAYSGRLHFNGLQGLDASTSFYYTTMDGFEMRDVDMFLWDIEAIYRVPRTGLELRGDFAYWCIGNPENLIANNTGSLTDNVGNRMYGWYVEAAYHLWPEAWREGRGREMDLVPFVRFSQIMTQSDLPTGTALDNGTANRDFITAGLAWYLSPRFVVKGDWRHNLNESDESGNSAPSQDYFQMGVGMAF